MSKCGQAAQRPLDPSREGGVAVDALLCAESVRKIKYKFRQGCRNLFERYNK